MNILWFIPTHGDSRYLGTTEGAREVNFDYVRQVASAADTLGYYGVLLPTGREDAGFGTGQPGFGFFGAFNHLFRRDAFLSLQAGVDLPLHASEAPRAAFLRAAIGKSHYQSGWGRMWTPMLEFSANRELVPGATTDWDIVPEFQVTLSRRQHIQAGAGSIGNTFQRGFTFCIVAASFSYAAGASA